MLINFDQNCIEARFIRRFKRFSVEVEYKGKKLWAHTNNTGSMMGLLRTGQKVYLSHSQNIKRKMPYTLELVQLGDMWVGVNTLVPNRILKLGFQYKQIEGLKSFQSFKSEVKRGDSRLDACAKKGETQLWIEAKNVTMVEDEIAAFPDAVTLRGQKHLRALIDMSKQGISTALFFFIQRSDGKCFAPADYIDPVYADLFYQAVDVGVQIWPYQAVISKKGIDIGNCLKIVHP
ncbi:XRE family transcriptional regulator [Candidatus Magnetomorum sp. HK-1]|nr:XRE family transcriptional regulator [Candidatus Magnetomorum sp. HK-1]